MGTGWRRYILMRPRPPPWVVSRARRSLVATRVALANELRANLEISFPGAATLFSDVDSPIALAFLRRFPSVTQAAWLTEARLAAFLRRMGYPGRKAAAELLRRLADAPAGLTGPEGQARATVTLGLVAALDTVRAQIDEFEGEVVERLGTHPDAAIFTALPRSGRVRAAALLAEIGDCRARFPDAESLTCLAGAAPSTRRSGKHKKVVFRFACDKKLRAAVMDFAGDSRHDNPWAAHVYQQARARGHRHAHAVRILARAWPG